MVDASRLSNPSENDKGDDEEIDRDDGEKTPETPLDEPRPPRVQDPPPQPDQRGPYVVEGRADLTVN
jgi:hypothetical protein